MKRPIGRLRICMNVTDIETQIQSFSARTEDIFLNLAEKFPMLLNKEERSSMDALLNQFGILEKANNTANNLEAEFFNNYDKKYSPLFDALNKRIEDLSNVNNNVRKIKDNSEEMELIALNAMVISIKSGEKGRAFSSITESLKQLSTDMNLYSNKLLDEEQQLLKQINGLRIVFDGILDSQKTLSKAGNSSSSDVNTLIQNASAPLQDIKGIINSAYPPIQNAMEGLQYQDIIRQAMEHIILCLHECSSIPPTAPTDEETLDNLTFNVQLLRLSSSVLEDICTNIKKSIDIFKNNWISVSETLRAVEPKRLDYIRRFMDKQNISAENIYENMAKINNRFASTLKQFGVYIASQKNLERSCSGITEKAMQMYAVFEALKPIIDRLHHVRILQQIEVAKNPAIAAVKDSVIDMDNLISSANDSLDEMQDMLNSFISSIKQLLGEFTLAIKEDSKEMNQVRLSKNAFFNEFHNIQDELSSILATFSVFPPGFEQLCISVQGKLDELENIYNSLRGIIVQMAEERMRLESRKFDILSRMGITSWELKDDRLKDLVTHFTITAHKEEAGEIGDFGVEDGLEAGEITFF